MAALKSLIATWSPNKWKKQIPRRRPEYKLKEYRSCEDLRSWSLDEEENRLWFYEKAGPSQAKMTAGVGGSIIPTSDVLDTILSGFKSQLEDLKYYRALPLTDYQLRLLEQMKAGHEPREDGDHPRELREDGVRKPTSEVPDDSVYDEQVEDEQAEMLTADSVEFSRDGILTDEETDIIRREVTPIDHEEIRRLSKQLTDSEESLHVNQAELKKLQAQISELEKVNLQLQEELKKEKENTKHLKNLEQEHDNVLSELEKCQEAMKQTLENERHLQDLINERDQLADKVEELSSIAIAYNDLESKLKDCDQIQQERDILRMKLLDFSQLEQDLSLYKYKSREAEVLRLERDRLQEQVEKLSSFPIALQRELDRNNELQAAAAERDYYRKKLEDVPDLESINSNLRKQLAEEMQKNTLLTSEIDQCQREVREQLELLEGLKANSHNKCLCDEKYLQSENQKQELEKSLTFKEEEIQRLHLCIHELSDNCQKTLTAYENIQKEQEEILQKLNNCQEENMKLSEMLQVLQNEKSNLEHACSVLQEEREEMHSEHLKLLEEINSRPSTDDLKLLQNENEKLQDMLKNALGRCVCLVEEKQNLESENLMLLQQTEDTEITDYVDSINKKNVNLQEKLQKAEELKQLLETEMNELNVQMIDLINKNKSLELEIDELHIHLENITKEKNEVTKNYTEHIESQKNEMLKLQQEIIKLKDNMEIQRPFAGDSSVAELLKNSIDKLSTLEKESSCCNLKDVLEYVFYMLSEIIPLLAEILNSNHQATEDVRILLENLDALKKENDTLRQGNNTLTQENHTLRQENDTLRQEEHLKIAAVNEEKQKLEEELKQFSECLCGHIEEIENNLTEERTKYCIAVQETEKLQNSVKDEIRKREGVENSLKLMQQEHQNLKDSLRECEENIRDYVSQIKDLQSKLEMERKETMKLSHLLEVSEIQLKTVDSSVEHMTESREEALRNFEKCNEELRVCKDTLQHAEEYNNSLELDKRELMDNIAMLHSAIKELKDNEKRLEKDKQDLEKVAQRLEEERKHSESDIHIVEEKMHALEEVNSLLKEERYELENEKNEIMRKLKECEKNLLLKEKEKKAADEEYEMTMNSVYEEVEELKKELNRMREGSVSSLKTVSEEKKALETENNRLTETVEQQKMDLKKMEEVLADLKSELESSKDNNATLSKELNDLQRKYSDLKEKCKCLESECTCLKSKTEVLENDLSEMASAVTGQRHEIQGLVEQLVEQAEKSESIEKDLLTSSLELKRDVAEVGTDKQLQHEFKECQDSKEVLLHTVQKLEEEIDRLKNLIAESSNGELPIGKLMSLENAKLEAEQNFKICEESNTKLKDMLKLAENELADFRQKYSEALEELSYTQQMRREMEQKSVDLENDLKECMQVNEELVFRIKDMEEGNAKHIKLLENGRMLAEKEEELKQKLESLENKNSEANLSLQAKEMELISCTEQNEHLIKTINDMEKKIMELETALERNKLTDRDESKEKREKEQLSVVVDRLETDIAIMGDKMTETETFAVDFAERTADDIQKEIMDLHAHIQEGKQDNELKTQKIKNLESNLEELNSKLKLCEDEKTKLLEDLEYLKKIQNTHLLGEMQIKDHSLTSTEENIDTLKDENMNLMRTIEELKKERDDCMENIEALRTKLNKESNAFVETEEKCKLEIEKLCLEYENKIQELLDKHKKEEQNLNENCQNALASFKNTYDREKAAMAAEHEKKIKQLQQLHEEEMNELKNDYESFSRDFEPLHPKIDNKINELIHETEMAKTDMQTEYDKKQMALSSELKDYMNKLKDELEKEEILQRAELDRLTNEHNKKLAQLREKYEKLTKLEEERYKQEQKKLKRTSLDLSETEVYELLPSDKVKAPLIDLSHQVQKELDIDVKKMKGDSLDLTKDVSDSKLIQILKKILREGINVLSLTELSLLHQHVASATSALILRSASQYKVPKYVNEQNEMWRLVSVAGKMENELKQKEEEANKKVRSMKDSITLQKQKILELRDELKKQQEQNNELHTYVSDQAHSIHHLKSSKDMLEKVSMDNQEEIKLLRNKLSKEEKRVKELEMELTKEKEKVKRLKKMLEDKRKKQQRAASTDNGQWSKEIAERDSDTLLGRYQSPVRRRPGSELTQIVACPKRQEYKPDVCKCPTDY